MLSSTVRNTLARIALLSVLTILLAGCAVVDQYGPRAVTYNEQESSSKSSSILLNVLRATYRQPLQFTDLTQVLGSASVSASVTGTSIPVRVGGPKFTTPETAIFAPAATMSGGPQFTIANLNTQEFYQGLQSPLEPQFLANYMSQGIPLKLLLTLFISDIEIKDTKTKRTIVIHNSAETLSAYNGFITAIDRLVASGLTLEQAKSADSFGPVLTEEQASDPKLLAGLVQAAAAASTGGSFTLQPATINGVVNKTKFQLSKPGGKWQFCFGPPPQQPYPESGYTILDQASVRRSVSIAYANRQVAAEFPGAECGKSNTTRPKVRTRKSRSRTTCLSFLGRSKESTCTWARWREPSSASTAARRPICRTQVAGRRRDSASTIRPAARSICSRWISVLRPGRTSVSVSAGPLTPSRSIRPPRTPRAR
jgi:hypothetical protein